MGDTRILRNLRTKLVGQGMTPEQAAQLKNGGKYTFGDFVKIAGLMAGGASALGAMGAGGAASAASNVMPGSDEEALMQAMPEQGRFRKIGGFLGKNSDDLLKYGQAAGDAYGAYRAGKAQDERLGMARGEWNRRAPLRQAGMQALMDDSTPDTSATFADPYDPTGRYRRVMVGSRGRA